MITFLTYKFLHWLYCWGEITTETKQAFTAISAVESFFEIGGIIGFCIINLPDILAERKIKR